MDFDIKFIDYDEESKSWKGIIKIGSFQEVFHASSEIWGRSEYLDHWKNSLKQLLEGRGAVGLINSYYGIEDTNFLFWWVFYREGDQVFIQEQTLFLNEIRRDLKDRELFEFMPKREVLNEDGLKISEWCIPIQGIQRFVMN